MKLYPLALAAGILPLLTIHICYLMAASNGYVPWCFPYFDSCTSISASGREGPQYYLFKGLMIPAAVIIIFYWWLCRSWLVNLRSRATKAVTTMVYLGTVACLGLIVYSVALGAIGDIYRMQRRNGVIIFFGLTYISQLLLTFALIKTNSLHNRLILFRHTLELISGTVLFAGLCSIVLSAFNEDYYDTLENAFEWTVTFLLCLHLLVTGYMWKLSGFRLRTETEANS